jgi:hypothetical protein
MPLHIVGETRPHDVATHAERNLEDAYLLAVGTPAAVA